LAERTSQPKFLSELKLDASTSTLPALFIICWSTLPTQADDFSQLRIARLWRLTDRYRNWLRTPGIEDTLQVGIFHRNIDVSAAKLRYITDRHLFRVVDISAADLGATSRHHNCMRLSDEWNWFNLDMSHQQGVATNKNKTKPV
jgi:hypothetical protein